VLDELRGRYTRLEIDLLVRWGREWNWGFGSETDRVLGLGHIDPIERQSIQRWTNLLIPYE